MQYSLPSITSLLNLKQQSAQLLNLKMWRKIEIKIRIENRLSFLCLVILIIDHIRWHAFIIKTPMMPMWNQICMELCPVFLSNIAAKDNFYFATYVPHTISMSSLKRKSQCHWWSQRWRSKLFQTSLFSSSFLQVQSTTNCLFTSYPMLRRDAQLMHVCGKTGSIR